MRRRIKYRPLWSLLMLIGAMLAMTGCGEVSNTSENGAKIDLTVSAAASLTDVLKEIQAGYETHNSSVKLNLNFGASGSLQQQIEQGAPVDVFISAAAENMKALVQQQLIDAEEHTVLLMNELVLVVPASVEGAAKFTKPEDLTSQEIHHIAIGEPQSVPAGGYAKEALIHAKLWDALEPKFVFSKDVRQVLTYVESGNAEAGFAYKTDALTSQQVNIASVIDPQSYPPIEYPVGIIKMTKHSKEAEDFYQYLQSREAADVFIKYGFSVPGGK
ncbi:MULTISPECIES: molybdate ABC transporter substrate-binding protein [unclassified Paenibacillus]|uniref:molybdate ABC transporter substrate-binding protein n=1 Tax=unclassified Paenibacillus TaxID=185978 RepID=UPI001AEBA37D|nr:MULTISPECIES: molybdate ABC transporter substrate-binding protein [unclassified Paenibacillus]MBP1153807.1 molybdate transport system substrate-binding protein [Paenibacillus sp. PvP091]MBP1170808.1 molybdate transport system substrate-binding protein [Paenibacillus sp. PvR098]MBP2441836.1 molybdate transport system substrate-binding protein [Paenibacillus sp. PvP052]